MDKLEKELQEEFERFVYLELDTDELDDYIDPNSQAEVRGCTVSLR